MARPADHARNEQQAKLVGVWDPLVRLFHWTLAAAFFVAYFTEDDVLTLHVWAGYMVGGVVVLRILWGFVGPQHARFTDFIFSPFTVWRYSLDLVRLRAKRYLGHSPIGAAMVFTLLVGLGATVWSGLELYAIEENAGPLAGPVLVAPVAANDRDETSEREGEEDQEDGGGADEFWEETHEVLANVLLTLVLIHIAGVVLVSLVHRENLTRAMINGRKRAE